MASAYREAWLDDPEVVERIVAQADGKPSPPPRPPLSEFGMEAALLADVVDRLGDVIAAQIAAGGNKPPKIQPTPRPVTGVERARAAVDRRHHEVLVDEVKAAQERWRATRGDT